MQKKSSLSKATIWYSLGNFFIRSISFLLLPLYSNLISTKEFGNYSLLMSIYVLVSVIYQFGMQAALSKFYIAADTDSKKGKVFSTVINSVLISGVFFTTVIFLFSGEISSAILGTQVYSNLVCLTFITLLADTIAYFGLHLLKTKEEAKKVVILSSVSAISNLLLNIIFVYSMKEGVAGIFYAQLISSIILILLLIPLLKHDYDFHIELTMLKTMFIFALPILISGLFSSAVDVSDRFIINNYLGKDLVGVYSFSYRVALVMNVFVISFRTAWVPHALNIYNQKKHAEVFGETLIKLISVGGLILLLITLFTGYLFDFRIFGITLLNLQYQSGLVILPFILLGYLFNGLASFYSVYPLVSNKTYHFPIADGIGFVTNLILNLILIPNYGLVGAALATAIAFAASALYLFIISESKLKIDYRYRELISIVVILFVFLAAGLVCQNIFLSLSIVIIFVLLTIKLTGFKVKSIFTFN
ncbi:MAG: lipopolysaccharide biosynthesis protein [Ignavibacteriaceae bacterium]